MTRLLIVGFGGALGSMARYGAGVLAMRLAPGAAWPWGTFSVNLIGGLLMGLVAGWLAQRGQGGDDVRLFIGVGALGGFTTFSAFSLEVAQMIERRDYGLATAYVLLAVVLAVAALMAGLMLARRAFGDVL